MSSNSPWILTVHEYSLDLDSETRFSVEEEMNYSATSFKISNPVGACCWIEGHGEEDLPQIQHLLLHVPSFYSQCYDDQEPPHGVFWSALIIQLALKAKSLETLDVYFEAEPSVGWFGGGIDVIFARALTMLHPGVNIRIGGYFAKELPNYLEARLGYKVWEEDEELHKLREEYLSNPEDLRDFQKGLPDFLR